MTSLPNGAHTEVMPGAKITARLVLMAVLVSFFAARAPAAAAATTASNLPDLSGICWIEGDMFVAVHDGKNPDENDRPRVSLIYRATSPAGVLWEPLNVVWNDALGSPNDFESIARIPGTRQMLLVESGDDSGPFHRIFLATLHSIPEMITARSAVSCRSSQRCALRTTTGRAW